ncbi:MAG: putative metal-binding motif-containing protein [Myxococcales bacterium]|nr:putative metal-binding motif-containing protein [Myxococcales bacterium]
MGCVPSRCTVDAECDDGMVCNGVERCDMGAPGSGCVPGDPPVCDDGFDCTTDACDEASSGCVASPDDSACADTIDCTVDRCAPSDAADERGCVHEPDDSLCDTDFCSVGRFCNPNRGCRGGSSRDCSDMTPCTVDSCDGSSRMCTHEPLDADMDGYPAASVSDPSGADVLCMGGTDCDDGEASVNPGAMELCNGTDDDCDGSIDEGCPPGTADDCSSAQEIVLDSSGRGSVRGTFDGLHDDYQTSPLCRAMTGARDAVYYIDLPVGLNDVTIDTIGSTADTVIGIGASCDPTALQTACSDDYDRSAGTASRIWLHRIGNALSTLRIYILVDGYRDTTSGDFVVNVQRRSAAGDSCTSIGTSGQLDISGGGTVVGQITNFTGAQRGSCESGTFNPPEAVMRVRGPSDGSMALQAYTTEFTPDLYLRGGGCTGTEVDCGTGASIGGGVNGVALNPMVRAGETYYLFLDGGRGAYVLYYTP